MFSKLSLAFYLQFSGHYTSTFIDYTQVVREACGARRRRVFKIWSRPVNDDDDDGDGDANDEKYI